MFSFWLTENRAFAKNDFLQNLAIKKEKKKQQFHIQIPKKHAARARQMMTVVQKKKRKKEIAPFQHYSKDEMNEGEIYGYIHTRII